MLLQRTTPSIRPLTTAHLAQTMSLLELNTDELRQKIETELSSNPALELVEGRRCPTCRRFLGNGQRCPLCSPQVAQATNQPIVFVSPRQDFHAWDRPGIPAEIEFPDENLSPAGENLAEYVLRQIAPELAPSDRAIAIHLLTSLNEDGLLEVQPVEIARFQHVTLTHVQTVMRIIQRADPPGVGSATPQEALLAQLEMLQENPTASQTIPSLTAEAIRAGLDLLNPKRAAELARRFGITLTQARQITRFISENLNPYPARAYWGEGNRTAHKPDALPSAYYHPDIIISKADAGESPRLIVEIITPLSGALRVNPLFRQALKEAPPGKSTLWTEDLERATLLIKCLQQRDHTMVRLMERITAIQREFILYGDAYLHPLTRASMADELKVHESTISRAVSGKAVQLPNRRIVPLAMFFDRSLHIRSAVKEIICQETSPLSDAQIVDRLKQKGYHVARRTVAKYRSMEGILPAHLRSYPNASHGQS